MARDDLWLSECCRCGCESMDKIRFSPRSTRRCRANNFLNFVPFEYFVVNSPLPTFALFAFFAVNPEAMNSRTNFSGTRCVRSLPSESDPFPLDGGRLG